VPQECAAYDKDGNRHFVHPLWNRRHCTKFNGVSYPVQRAAEAIYSDAGKIQAKELVDYYMKNAALICETMESLGYSYDGGKNSPYVWVEGNMESWQFFDMLLNKAGVVCTPGAGFGKCGKGYIRFSAFNSYENVEMAMQRIRQALAK
jgi:LL-diaminopimelate aminotransferase